MKILITMYEIQDYGGITSHIEFLIRGLREAGHEVDFVMLRNNDQNPYTRKFDGPVHSYPSLTGGSVHLLAGWYGVLIMSYGSEKRAKEFVEYAEQYDYIIWGLPCPYDNEGYWRELYRSNVPQVAVIHDAHYERAYKHLDDVNDLLAFVAPVNESALGALVNFPGEVVLINNGVEIQDYSKEIPWENRAQNAVCAHVWKAWKRMDRAVAATPYLGSARMIMGGDGIEGRYMRSKDKCKLKYQGLWSAFLSAGGKYLGVMTPSELTNLYSNSRIMIDLSWNEKFAKYGCHYNRSIVEGINYGCLPLVTWETFKDSKIFPISDIMTVGHYEAPQDLGFLIDYAVNIRPEEAHRMLFNLRNVIADHFDYRKTSIQYLQPLGHTVEQSEDAAGLART